MSLMGCGMVDFLNALMDLIKTINEMVSAGIAVVAVLAVCMVAIVAIWVLGGKP
ncbi:hypothetical protein [Pseudomethylobacillus aquaticus]|uniref:hypothetical protein n=1 Tax=Pseudomethylobacillus aquaticus TaxID=2676064 RepID=UPI0012D834E5|nr:hypothetical protein [Pseudomethylobacillus aquaticus]